MKKRGRARQATTWRMRFTSWLTRAANTHAEHVTHTAFSRQQRLPECASMLCLHVQSLSSLTGNMEKKNSAREYYLMLIWALESSTVHDERMFIQPPKMRLKVRNIYGERQGSSTASSDGNCPSPAGRIVF